MSEDNSTPPEEAAGPSAEPTGTSRLRYSDNDALHVAEATFAIITSLLPMIPLQVVQGDINSMRQLEQATASINNLGMLLQEMGSKLIKADPNPQGNQPSGLIIPR